MYELLFCILFTLLFYWIFDDVCEPEAIALIGFDPDAVEKWRAALRTQAPNVQLADRADAVYVCATRRLADLQRHATPASFIFACTESGASGSFWGATDFAVSEDATLGVCETLGGFRFCFKTCQIHLNSIVEWQRLVDPLDHFITVQDAFALADLLTVRCVPAAGVPPCYDRLCEVLRHLEDSAESALLGNRSANEIHVVNTEPLKRFSAQLAKYHKH